MTTERIDYVVRVSFSTLLEGSSLSLEEQAAEIMAGLMKGIAAGVDEAEIVHRRVFKGPEASRPSTSSIPLPCVRCGRFMATSFERYCAACWGLAR